MHGDVRRERRDEDHAIGSNTDTTMWSSVYDLTTGEFEIAYRQQYEEPFRDRLELTTHSALNSTDSVRTSCE